MAWYKAKYDPMHFILLGIFMILLALGVLIVLIFIPIDIFHSKVEYRPYFAFVFTFIVLGTGFLIVGLAAKSQGATGWQRGYR